MISMAMSTLPALFWEWKIKCLATSRHGGRAVGRKGAHAHEFQRQAPARPDLNSPKTRSHRRHGRSPSECQTAAVSNRKERGRVTTSQEALPSFGRERSVPRAVITALVGVFGESWRGRLFSGTAPTTTCGA